MQEILLKRRNFYIVRAKGEKNEKDEKRHILRIIFQFKMRLLVIGVYRWDMV